jgi:hypothetical protein
MAVKSAAGAGFPAAPEDAELVPAFGLPVKAV